MKKIKQVLAWFPLVGLAFNKYVPDKQLKFNDSLLSYYYAWHTANALGILTMLIR